MVTWDPYLASIRQEYAQWWHVYTLTDVEDRKRKEQQATPGLFNFDLMVQTIKSEQPQIDENREETERLPVLAGLRKYAAEHVLLVGRPGSGKSTALVRLLGDEGIQDKIPVLVELRYYQTSVLELVKHFLESHLGQPLDSKEIEKLLFDRQFLLLIDGVNELPSEAARLDLTKFRQKYQKTTPMIFTTRDLGVGGDLGIEKKLEMQPLSAAQMSEFVRKYLPQQGEQMLNQLGNRLRELGETPLLLMMLCSLFQNKGEIPSNLGLVFRSFTQFYSEKIKQDVNVSEESREFWPDLLQQLGFVMTTGDNPKEITVAIPKTKAQEILTDYLRHNNFTDPDVRARTWLKDLLNYHLIQQSGDLIEFRHQLIQEYYTAEYLLKQLPRLSDQELQQNYLNYLKWTESLVLMLQLVDNEAEAQRVVRLGLAVDWQLGARLAGAVKPEFQEQTVGLVAQLEIPKLLKVELLGITESDRAIPELTKCLDDDDSSVGIMAVYALEKIGIKATINRLIKFLDDDDSSVRIRAAEALEKIGTEATIEPLMKCLYDNDSSVRRSAAEALGKIGRKATINPLVKCLEEDDDDSDVRRSAVDALGKIGTEATIESLIKCLDDKDSSVRRSAVDALGKIRTKATIKPLIKCLDDKDSSVRISAADALGKIRTEAAIQPLIKCLNYHNDFVRTSAADALGKIGKEAVIDPLTKWLDNDNYFVHSSAAFAMVKMRIEVAIEPLVEYLDYPESSVRRMAARTLGEMGTEEAIQPLIKCLDDDDCIVRRIAASALANMRTETTIDPLIKCLDDDDYLVQYSAAFALVKMGKKSGINKLLKCLNNPNIVVRIFAANTLGDIGKKRFIYPLIKCLDDEHKAVRFSAAFALYKIGEQVPIDPLIKCLDDEWSSVRIMAGKALRKIARETTITKLINLLNKADLAATSNVINFYDTINVLSAIQQRYQVYNPIYCPKPTPKADPPKFIATKTIYILHLSDLHITTLDQATLWSNQLAQDLTQDLDIPHLDALILSGDIANYSTTEEYQAAQQFLHNFRQEFPLDPKQIVLVPGNHDLNWELSEDAYDLRDRKKYQGKLEEGHYIEESPRAIWVRDDTKYQQRFAHFSQFYQAIKGQAYSLDYDEQAIIDHFPEQNLLILGLNSAWQLDHHFRARASIHPGALSKALTKIRRNPDYVNCLKIAVWHHPLNSDGSDRITDQGFMQQLAVAGFRLFLHGHIHKAQASLFPYDLSRDGRKLHGICAGTFSAPTFELRSAYPWQYNLLKINDNQLTVYTRRREEENGAWKPDSRWTQGPGLGSLDYYSIDL
ncbi:MULTISPECIES: HEAT repeat domain-containing protein [unclassified Moorena]|uniref:HEAT repeat domain-containing protein n=1 Tax=unclassified Moorena TaxID=2683338 RepID=UPI0013C9ABB6|nr:MULTISPECIES: HEAT repeat domain-containing protein [unclassified Moorena]NEO23661.1 NACHT domain-containing protein [Moorena sp. SIO4A5]NEQ58476.1 NACHT domain-containing protein [Moorena sp. SIO4A1]